MPLFVLPFPAIDPVLLHLGPFALRWYALAYIAGLVAGWWLIRRLVATERYWDGAPRPAADSIDDLLVFVALGVVLGGRLGNALFYDPGYYLAHPLEIVEVWKGGMAFHGGLIGAMAGAWLFARREKVPFATVFDLMGVVAPIGIFFGRIANFIRPELWGRPTDVPWAMVFPGSDGQPRHPSQLYEAGLEGLASFLIILIAVRLGALRRPGRVAGLFGVLYACARTFSEFYRDPDPKLEDLGGGLTMGMVLSMPMLLVGVALIVYSLRKRPS